MFKYKVSWFVSRDVKDLYSDDNYKSCWVIADHLIQAYEKWQAKYPKAHFDNISLLTDADEIIE